MTALCSMCGLALAEHDDAEGRFCYDQWRARIDRLERERAASRYREWGGGLPLIRDSVTK